MCASRCCSVLPSPRTTRPFTSSFTYSLLSPAQAVAASYPPKDRGLNDFDILCIPPPADFNKIYTYPEPIFHLRCSEPVCVYCVCVLDLTLSLLLQRSIHVPRTKLPFALLERCMYVEIFDYLHCSIWMCVFKTARILYEVLSSSPPPLSLSPPNLSPKKKVIKKPRVPNLTKEKFTPPVN